MSTRSWHPSTDEEQIDKVFRQVDETLDELGMAVERRLADNVRDRARVILRRRGTSPPVHTITEDYDGEIYDSAVLVDRILDLDDDDWQIPSAIVRMARGIKAQETAEAEAFEHPSAHMDWRSRAEAALNAELAR